MSGFNNRWLVVVFVIPALASAYSWVARCDGPDHLSDQAAGVVLAAADTLYVVGTSANTTDNDLLVVKYRPAGDTAWTRRYGGAGSQSAAAACRTPDGIVVAGTDQSDFLVLKYSPAGALAWAKTWNGPAGGDDQAVAVAADAAGNIYAAGYATVGTHQEATVVKYDAAGTRLWVSSIALPTGNPGTQAAAVAVDNSGYVYLCGTVRDAFSSTDFLLARIKPDGDTAWTRSYSGPGNGADAAVALVLDGTGVVVTGSSLGSGTDYDYATVKYDAAGTQVWAKRYNGSANDEDRATALALDPAGSIFVTGFSTSNSNWEDFLTVKYDAAGTQLWTRRTTSSGGAEDIPCAVAADAAGNCYVAGYVTGGNDQDFLAVKLDPAGSVLWDARYDHPQAHDDDWPAGLALSSGGALYVTGTSYDDDTRDDFLTIKYLEKDFGVAEILAPGGPLAPQPVVPSARVVNCGVAVAAATVYCTISRTGVVVYSAQVTTPEIQPDNDYDVEFRCFVGDTGSYVVRCSLALDGDANRANDTLAGSFALRWGILPYWAQVPHDVPAGPEIKGVKDGGALAAGRYTTNRQCIYALKGNKTNEFCQFQITADSWHTLLPLGYAPDREKEVKKGGALCYNRYDTTVYALKGNNTLEFWRYSSPLGSWAQEDDVPLDTAEKKVKGGAGLVFWRAGTSDDRVYALKGGKKLEFWCFRVQADTWLRVKDVPLDSSGKGMADGSCIVNAGGVFYALKGTYNEFSRYYPALDSWEKRRSLPLVNRAERKKKAKMGTALCYGNDAVYALKGGTYEFWAYYPAADTWIQLESIPAGVAEKKVKAGGALAFARDSVWALKGNKTLEFWTYFPGEAAPAPGGAAPDRGVQAGPAAVRGPRLLIEPNPATGGLVTLRCAAPGPEPVTVTVFDIAGRPVRRSCGVRREASSVRLDVGGLARGVYVVRLRAGAAEAAGRLVVAR